MRDRRDAGEHRVCKVAQVVDENDEKRPVEKHGPEPEIPVRPVDQLLSPLQFYPIIAQKAAEEKHLKGHPAEEPRAGRGAFEAIRSYPREGSLLSAGRRDVKRDRGSSPLRDTIDETADEKACRQVGDCDAKEYLQAQHSCPDPSYQDKTDDSTQGVESLFQ